MDHQNMLKYPYSKIKSYLIKYFTKIIISLRDILALQKQHRPQNLKINLLVAQIIKLPSN